MTCAKSSVHSSLEAFGELHKVQATLGHTNIKMTGTYLNGTT